MSTITLNLTDMAYGGAALGRDERNRVVFVPFSMPGERVVVEIIEDKKRFTRARLLEVLEPSSSRVSPKCPHFSLCGGCHFQHIDYPSQLEIKEAVIHDQLMRIGGLDNPHVHPVIPNPDVWQHSNQVSFSQSDDRHLGFWSPESGTIMPIDTCHILQSPLLDLFQQIDLDYPNVNQLTLRLGYRGDIMAILDLDEIDPPAVLVDLAASVAYILPDGSAVSLVGDPYILMMAQDQPLRVSATSFFYPNSAALSSVIEAVDRYAGLTGGETLFDLYSGVGTFSLFLAPKALAVVGVESNPDSIADAAANLDAFDRISLYQGQVDEILPMIDIKPDVIVVDPPVSGLPPLIIDEIADRSPERLIYVSSDVATLARDGQRLTKNGFVLDEVQPIDMYPHNYRVLTVSSWNYKGRDE